MRTKTILAVVAAAFLGCGLLVQQSQAIVINQMTGNITFGGTVQLNSASADTATQVTAWHGIGGVGSPFVTSHDGQFSPAVTDGDPVAFATPWNFNSGAIPNFWSVDGFIFSLTSSAITSQIGGGVVVDGTGFVSGNGFTATPGSWHFTTQNPSANASFSFSAATGAVAQVPDGGSSVALLGIALAGVEAVRRKIRARKA
jgi:hypothetical protein